MKKALPIILELLGLLLLMACAWFAWPPAVLGVAGAALIAIGVAHPGEGDDQ